MTSNRRNRVLPLLLCLAAILFCVSVCTIALGADLLTYQITYENDDWEEEIHYVSVEPIPDQIYDEYGAEPELTMYLDGVLLTDDDIYSVDYRDNYTTGTAYACVDFYWPYDGYFEVPFTITQIDASSATIDAIPAQEFTGWEIEPDVTVRLDGQVLSFWDDYDLSFSNNTDPGTATVTVTFTGAYTGTIRSTFSIVILPVRNLKATANGTCVDLQWTGSWNVTSYLVQRYDAAKKKYVNRKVTQSTYFTDYDLAEITTYKYRVLPIVKTDNKQWKGTAAALRVTTGLQPVRVTLATQSKKIRLSWTPSAKADGYLIYRTQWINDWETGKVKKLGKLANPAAKAYVDKKITSGVGYSYAVLSYKKLNGKTYLSDYEWVYSLSTNAVLAGVKKVPQRSYAVYNTQGTKTTLLYNINLSDKDIATLDKFAKKYFKPGWTDVQKLQFTLTWINQNVTYATGNLWNKIESKTYVDAIFNNKLGQCVQYNGAMAAMIVHLGYPARLIMGYRGTWPNNIWQHFWVESPINGRVYVVECGNAGRSGSWSYFFEPYKNTFGYIKNRKNVS